MALSKSISTGLIKTWAIGKKTSIKYKNLKYPQDKDRFDRTKPHWPQLEPLQKWADAKGIPVYLVAKSISEKLLAQSS